MEMVDVSVPFSVLRKIKEVLLEGTNDWCRLNFHSLEGKTIKGPMFCRQEP